MDTNFVIFNAMWQLAKAYNPNDLAEWGEKHSLLQQANLINEKITEMGYRIKKGLVYELQEEGTELTTNDGE